MGVAGRSVYEVMGGERAVRALIQAFYDIMDTDPAASTVRAMHPADLTEARERLTLFTIAWFGGPLVYHRTHGHPRLRASHAAFPIDADAVEAWMACMDAALERCVPDAALRDRLSADFRVVAEHIRNR